MLIENVNLIEKQIRAEVIMEHLAGINEYKCVCFTCGNATKALRNIGVEVVSVGDNEELKPAHWFNYTEIQRVFGGLFDATSGHLPMPLMQEIATRLKIRLGELKTGEVYYIDCGSGETIVCLAMAYPAIVFKPQRLAGYAPTSYSIHAPLNKLLLALFGSIGAEYG